MSDTTSQRSALESAGWRYDDADDLPGRLDGPPPTVAVRAAVAAERERCAALLDALADAARATLSFALGAAFSRAVARSEAFRDAARMLREGTEP